LHPYTHVNIIRALLAGGYRPVFADISVPTLSLDLTAAKERLDPNVRVLLWTHLFGIISDMSAAAAFAQQYHLHFVEDVSQAVGCYWNKRPVGSFGTAAIASCAGLKPCATIRGGVLLDDQLPVGEPPAAIFPPALRDQAIRYLAYDLATHSPLYALLQPAERLLLRHYPAWYDRIFAETIPSWTELPAACPPYFSAAQAQLGLDLLNGHAAGAIRRRELISMLLPMIAACPRAWLPLMPAAALHSFWRFPLFVPRRDRWRSRLAGHGIATAVDPLPAWWINSPWQEEISALPGCRFLRDTALLLPVYDGLPDSAIKQLAAAVNDCLLHRDCQ